MLALETDSDEEADVTFEVEDADVLVDFPIPAAEEEVEEEDVVITFKALFIASEVGVPLFKVGGVAADAGGCSCCVSTFNCCIDKEVGA